MRRSILVALILVTALGAYLRCWGFEWGIPKAPYWRNHYQDEAFVLGLLFKMGPDNLNPHYFINPTLHYYTLLLSLKAASVFGVIEPFSLPVKTNELGQPESGVSLVDYSRMYATGRILTLIESVALIFLIFLIGRNLYNDLTGIIAAAFTAVLPTAVFQSRFLVVDAPALFWFALAFWILTTDPSSLGMRRWAWLCGIFMGIAIGTKYTNGLLLVPFFYRIYCQHAGLKRRFMARILNRDSIGALVVAAGFFLFTTPYALLTSEEFLRGDVNGFGGIFGERGLFFYNAYPASLITPFSVTTFNSLQLPLTILAFMALLYLFLKRTRADLTLLFYIVPFYAMMVYHASPHLRHVLMVLPFLMIAVSRMMCDLMTRVRKKAALAGIGIAGAFVFAYTLAFSLSLVLRITPTDTRIECAEWMRKNADPQAAVGLASYFPWNYTPPVEIVLENIKLVDFNYDRLLSIRPEYFIITEYELASPVSSRESATARKQFISHLFDQRDYVMVKEFSRKFEFLGITFNPRYPNMDWNPVNPAVYVFKLRS
jgi:hypothetical protein